MTYLVNMSVTLRPVKLPNVKIGINGDILTVVLDKTETMDFEFRSDKDCRLTVELVDKKDQEAVVVESVSFFGITDPKFAWAGVYEPQYPEPWATQQQQAGKELPESFKNVTTIGHNGRWELGFESPFYMWLLENLY